jgi:hypothetical protein
MEDANCNIEAHSCKHPPVCSAVPQPLRHRVPHPLLGQFANLLEATISFVIYTRILYTGCNRDNGPDFGRVFLMLNYTEKTQNTYIRS